MIKYEYRYKLSLDELSVYTDKFSILYDIQSTELMESVIKLIDLSEDLFPNLILLNDSSINRLLHISGNTPKDIFNSFRSQVLNRVQFSLEEVRFDQNWTKDIMMISDNWINEEV